MMKNAYGSLPDHVPFLNASQMNALAEHAERLRSLAGGYRIDDNPFPIPGGLTACGPTTGRWLEANDLTEIGWWVVGGVRFTLAI